MKGRWRALLGASAIVASGVIAGRLLGVVREAVLAARLGAGADADVAVLLLTFPDLLTAFLISGSASALLVPAFTRAGGGAPRVYGRALVIALAGSIVVAIVVALAASPISDLLAPGFAPERRDQVASLLRIVGLAVPFAALAAVATAYLQSHGRFVISATGTPIVNAVLIATLLIAVAPSAIAPLAVGIVVASVLRWVPQAIAVARVPPRSEAATGPEAPSSPARMARAYAEALGATSVLLLLPFAARAIASLGASGDVAVLSYATRIVELPLGAFVTVASVAALPQLASLFAKTPADPRASGAVRSLAGATFLATLPVALVMIVAAVPIAALVYERGGVDAATVSRIGLLAAIGLASLPAQALSSVIVATFAARHTLRAPLLMNTVGLVIYLPVAYAGQRAFGVVGIMAAYGVLHVLLAIAGALLLWRALSHTRV